MTFFQLEGCLLIASDKIVQDVDGLTKTSSIVSRTATYRDRGVAYNDSFYHHNSTTEWIAENVKKHGYVLLAAL
ncbi:sulfurtransferase [Sesbania bispinosa]|nr:sulfurtransferase [Sesbania bispinosa]